MSSFWSATVQTFLDTPPDTITGALAVAQIRHFRINETRQLRAWEASIAMLRAGLADLPEARAWQVLLEYPMLRLGRRPDTIILTDRAILVLEFKAGATQFTPADRRQVEDYAIDLHDFHAASRHHPILPILVAEHAPAADALLPMPIAGAMVCLVGGGQEIHHGEGGLAEWGNALRASPALWRVRAAPDILSATDPRQRLGRLPGLAPLPALHLDVSIRQIRSAAAAGWVNHVLAGEAPLAAALALSDGAIPFHLTRSLAHLRAWLQAKARGLRRAGLLASSGAKRLRAEGLGAELPHQDPAAVAHWFLDHFPDIRASNALETVATEFSCQGLELDYAGLCWGTDLIREPDRIPWRVRQFRGTAWQVPRGEEAIANQINTYRVLLTRARYETAIFVPPGHPADPTRSPATLDNIAAFLTTCGARELTPHAAAIIPEPEMLLL